MRLPKLLGRPAEPAPAPSRPEPEEDALELFAGRATVSVEHARLHAAHVRLLEDAQRQQQEAAALEAVARAVNSSWAADEVFRLVVDQAREVLRTDLAYLAPYDAEAAVASATAVAGTWSEAIRTLTVRRGEGAGGRVLELGEPVWTVDYATDAGGTRGSGPALVDGMATQAIVPLRFGGAITGLLAVMSRAPRRFAPGDVAFLSRLADLAATALENGRLADDLRRALREVGEGHQRIAQTARLRALGEMASGVAHDFNNTLAVILGRVQLLRKATTDANTLRQFDVIEEAARDGTRTVQRIQELTRARPARPFQAVDLNQVVGAVVEATRPRWKEEAEIHGVRYDVGMRLTPVPPVMGDAAELREALTNLLFNALDAMPRGGAVTIDTRREGGLVMCQLSDTGAGMPEDVRRRVFDPFFTTKGEKGTGLGLSVTGEIIGRHGGEIDVVSELGLGSAFTIRLPVGRETARHDERAAPRPHRYARILVIDDEPAVGDVLTELLAAQGHAVETVRDGMAALQRLREVDARFDLVMSDLAMPGLSGWEVAKLVARYRPGTPVVLVTGYADRLVAEETDAKGIDFVVAKPFDHDAIQTVVARALAQRDFGASARPGGAAPLGPPGRR